MTPPIIESHRPAHVVQVVQSIDRGGLEMMAVELAIALRDRGIHSSVVSFSAGGRLEERLRTAGVRFESIETARYWSPVSHVAVLRVLRRLRATVVHTHHLASLLNAGPAARAMGVSRVVHTEHAHAYLDEEPRFRRILRWAAHMTDTVALVGNALVPYFTHTVGIAPSRLRVVPNGIDTDRFRPMSSPEVDARRSAVGLPVGGLLIGAVGRLAAVKNYGLLLRATARARAAGALVSLALVGDGEERAALEGMVRELGLAEHTTFMGWRTDVADLVGTFDVLAVTSISEALPLVVLEAMSSGVPVLSTAVGEIPHVLDGESAGIVVAPNDVEAFSAALHRFASDQHLRRAMGDHGRARVCDAYSHSTMIDRYLELYGLVTPESNERVTTR